MSQSSSTILASNYGFPEALRFTLKWEGGFVDDPDDRGGRTNKGITQTTYDSYLKGKGQPSKDVKNIQDSEVHDIYRQLYWAKAFCDEWASPLNAVVFDTAVNMGVNRAIKVLQTAAGCTSDGICGSGTRGAVKAADHATLVKKYCDVREGLYRQFAQNGNQKKFLRGWLNRLNDLRKYVGLPVDPSSVSYGDLDPYAPWTEERNPNAPLSPSIADLADEQPLEDWEAGLEAF